MAKSEARRQKQLAKKKAKRDDKRVQLVKANSDDPTIRLAGAERWPIVHALVPVGLWDTGIGSVILTRRCPDGKLACAIFLLDTWCLGVKDAFWKILSESEAEGLIRKSERGGGPFRKVEPEHFAKLVYSAVAFARSLGFAPAGDYGHACMLLAGIDADACQDIFEFGRDGKPCYIQGPHDSPARVRSIMQRLQAVQGDFLLVAGKRTQDTTGGETHILE